MSPPVEVEEFTLLRMAEELYRREPMGGPLHIVLDDGNLETEHVAWCLWTAIEEGDQLAAEIAYHLLRMTDVDRTRWYFEWFRPSSRP